MDQPQQTQSHLPPDDEIDLAEIGFALWMGRARIILSAGVAALIGLIYAYSTPPIYTTKTIFELSSNSLGAGSISSQYAGLASFAGIDLGGNENKNVFDRLDGRDFIKEIADDLDLKNDAYFNPPPASWSISDILSITSGGKKDIQPDPMERIFEVYKKSVTASDTKNGSISISVSHTDPVMAANIANQIVTRLAFNLKRDQQIRYKDQFDYLSAQVADALAQLEKTKRAVSEFALANGLSSPQVFAARSENIFNLREDLRRVTEMMSALAEMKTILEADTSPDSHVMLRKQHPIIDDPDFRNLVGLPENTSLWEWPDLARIGEFINALKDRQVRINRAIAEFSSDAERYAKSAEQLTSLEREAAIAQATYAILIEQVKTRSIIDGYQPAIVKIYQSAVPPHKSSWPKKTMLLLISLIIGGMIGSGWVLFSSLRKGYVYTASSYQKLLDAVLLAEIAPATFGKKSVESLSKWGIFVSKIPERSLAALGVAFANNKGHMSFMGAASRQIHNVLPYAFWLLKRKTLNDSRVAILAVGEKFPKDIPFKPHEQIGCLETATLENITLLRPIIGSETEMVFVLPQVYQALSTPSVLGLDHIMVVVGESQVESAALALSELSSFTIILAQPGKTEQSILLSIKKFFKIDALILGSVSKIL